MALYLLDNPGFDPDWKINVPKLIQWTEENFVFRTEPGEPATQWGANIVGEQDSFKFKMDYQTARYGAQCARWFAVSGDESYKAKAYRALNWVTYTNNPFGQCFESPVSPKPISNWWSDCYGEGPRMFYAAFAGVPEWAPPHEDHILYSTGIIRQVTYALNRVAYIAAGGAAADYLRLSFAPARVVLEKQSLTRQAACVSNCYSLKPLGQGDFAVTIRRSRPGSVRIE